MLYCFLLLFANWQMVRGATFVTTQNGNFNTGSTWVGGTAPSDGDDIVIAHTVTFDNATNLYRSITIDATGTLDFQALTARTLNLSGDFINNGTFNGGTIALGSISLSFTNNYNTSGSFVNTGTFNSYNISVTNFHLQLFNDLPISVSTNFTVTNSRLTGNSNTLSIPLTATLTVQSSSTLSTGISDGANFAGGLGTKNFDVNTSYEFTVGNTSTGIPTATFASLHINGANTSFPATTTHFITGDLVVSSGTLSLDAGEAINFTGTGIIRNQDYLSIRSSTFSGNTTGNTGFLANNIGTTPSGTLNLSGGSLTLTGTSNSFTGTTSLYSLEVTGVSIINGNYTITGPIYYGYGVNTTNTNGTVKINSVTNTMRTAGTLRFTNLEVNGSTTMTLGTYLFSGTTNVFTVNGSFNQTTGILQFSNANTAVLSTSTTFGIVQFLTSSTFNSSSDYTYSNSITIQSNAVIENTGSVTFSGSGITINTAASTTFNLNNLFVNGVYSQSGSVHTVNISGNITVTSLGSLSLFSSSLTGASKTILNLGTLSITTIHLSGSYTNNTIIRTTTFNINSGASYTQNSLRVQDNSSGLTINNNGTGLFNNIVSSAGFALNGSATFGGSMSINNNLNLNSGTITLTNSSGSLIFNSLVANSYLHNTGNYDIVGSASSTINQVFNTGSISFNTTPIYSFNADIQNNGYMLVPKYRVETSHEFKGNLENNFALQILSSRNFNHSSGTFTFSNSATQIINGGSATFQSIYAKENLVAINNIIDIYGDIYLGASKSFNPSEIALYSLSGSKTISGAGTIITDDNIAVNNINLYVVGSTFSHYGTSNLAFTNSNFIFNGGMYAGTNTTLTNTGTSSATFNDIYFYGNSDVDMYSNLLGNISTNAGISSFSSTLNLISANSTISGSSGSLSIDNQFYNSSNLNLTCFTRYMQSMVNSGTISSNNIVSLYGLVGSMTGSNYSFNQLIVDNSASVTANSCSISSSLDVKNSSTFLVNGLVYLNGATPTVLIDNNINDYLSINDLYFDTPITVNGSMRIAGDIITTSSLLASNATSTITFIDNSLISNGSFTFTNLAVSGTMTSNAGLNITGSLFNTGNLALNNDINLYGTNNQIVNTNSASFYRLNFSNSSSYNCGSNFNLTNSINMGISSTFINTSNTITNLSSTTYTTLSNNSRLRISNVSNLSPYTCNFYGVIEVFDALVNNGNLTQTSGTFYAVGTSTTISGTGSNNLLNLYVSNNLITASNATINNLIELPNGTTLSSTSGTLNSGSSSTIITNTTGAFQANYYFVPSSSTLYLGSSTLTSNINHISGYLDGQTCGFNTNASRTFIMSSTGTFSTNSTSGLGSHFSNTSNVDIKNGISLVLEQNVLNANLSNITTTFGNINCRSNNLTGTGSATLSGNLLNSGTILLTNTADRFYFDGVAPMNIYNTNSATFNEIYAWNNTLNTSSSFEVHRVLSTNTTGTFLAISPSIITFNSGLSITGLATGNGGLYVNDIIINTEMSNNAALFVSGNFTVGANGYLNPFTGSNYYFTGTSKSITVFENETVSSGLLLPNVFITGSYSIPNPYAIEFGGNLTINPGASLIANNNSTLRFVGDLHTPTNSATITNNGTLSLANLEVASTATNGVAIVGDYSCSGSISVDNNGLLRAYSSMATLNGTNQILLNQNINLPNALRFDNLTINSSSVTTSSDFTINEDLIFSNASSTLSQNSGTLVFADNGVISVAGGFFKSNNMRIEDERTTNSNFTIGGGLHLTNSSASLICSLGSITFSGANQVINNQGYAKLYALDFAPNSSYTYSSANNLELLSNLRLYSASSLSFTNSTPTVFFNGGLLQTITVNSATCYLSNMRLNNLNGLRLSGNIADYGLQVGGILYLESGDLDLYGGNIIRIGTNGTLNEIGGRVLNSIDDINQAGYIATLQNLPTNVSVINLAGFGIGISQPGTGTALNDFEIRRYHTVINLPDGPTIDRAFYLNSSSVGTSSTLTFNYLESDLNGLDENELELVSSSSLSANYSLKNSISNTITNFLRTNEAVDSYSGLTNYWTAIKPTIITFNDNTNGIIKQRDSINKRLSASSTFLPLCGVNITANGITTVSAIRVFLNGNTDQFENIRLVQSTDEFFTTDADNMIVSTVATAGDTAIFTNLNINLTATSKYTYFITADVNENVDFESPSVNVTLDQTSFITSTGLSNFFVIGDSTYNFQNELEIEQYSNQLASSPLIYSQDSIVLAGLKIKSKKGKSTFDGISINLENSPLNSLSGLLKIYKSSDSSFYTKADNRLISQVNQAIISSSSEYSISFTQNDTVNTDYSYYFIIVDSISSSAGDNSPNLTPRINLSSIKSNLSRNYGVSTFTYPEIYFDDLEIAISASYIPSGNIARGLINQAIYGFEVSANNNAVFNSVTLKYDLNGGSLFDDFFNFRLAYDSNNDGFASDAEVIDIAQPNLNREVVFNSFSAIQNFIGNRKYLVVADIKSNTTENSTITMYIPSNANLGFSSPAQTIVGGPFNGNIRTVKSPGTLAKIAISYAPNFFISGQSGNLTVQLLDSSNTPTLSPVPINFNLSFIGSSTFSSSVSHTIPTNTNFLPISGVVLTNNVGEIGAYFTIADILNINEVPSATFIVISEFPSTVSSNLVLQLGSQPTSQVNLVSWQNGSGDGRIIVMRQGAIPEDPTNGINYTANTNFSTSIPSTSRIGSESYVVYSGSGLSGLIPIVGLAAGGNYNFKIFDYNGEGSLRSYNSLIVNQIFSITTNGSQVASSNTSIAPQRVFVGNKVRYLVTEPNQDNWFNFNVNQGRNIEISFCGNSRDINLYRKEGNNLVAIRQGNNNGTNCSIIILNSANSTEYLLNIANSNNYSSSYYNEFEIKTFSNEVFSNTGCNCP